LEGPHGRLRLGGQAAIDRAWVTAKGLQVLFRDLDVS
jgi:hypothetical protein